MPGKSTLAQMLDRGPHDSTHEIEFQLSRARSQLAVLAQATRANDTARATAASIELKLCLHYAQSGIDHALRTSAIDLESLRDQVGGLERDAEPALAAAVAPGGFPHRAAMEAAFGADFSTVEVRTGEHSELSRIGATAATEGNRVTFADSSPDKWLVAHELAHVMQFRNGSASVPIDFGASAPEHEADRVADRVMRGEAVGAINERPVARVHRHSPARHRESTVQGLAGSFSPEEIGDIYAASWERDFSQGNREIANAVLAWIELKNNAKTDKQIPALGAAKFKLAIKAVFEVGMFEAKAESLGGYQTWEHIDRPEDMGAAADKRWAGQATDGLAGYLLDARAYIKDQLVAAVDFYRLYKDLGPAGLNIDNWGSALKPPKYVSPQVTLSGNEVAAAMPTDFDLGVAERDPIRVQTAAEARDAKAVTDPKYDPRLWRSVGQMLGRAMHAFEDFWAHSNWLEIAKAMLGGEPRRDTVLRTGTFEAHSKEHALGHKLVALATELKADLDGDRLLLKVYGRSEASTKLESDRARHEKPNGEMSDHDLVYGPLEHDLPLSPYARIFEAFVAKNAAESLVESGDYAVADFLCNQHWLSAVEAKGRRMIERGDREADASTHAKTAKDQPEADSGKDARLALAISIAADRMVFGPIRAIMNDRDADNAEVRIRAQLALIDRMMQAPSPSHPLWELVAGSAKPRRADPPRPKHRFA